MTSVEIGLRIGGDFELLMSDLSASPAAATLTFGRRHEQWLDTGRSAILLAIKAALRSGASRRVWLPAFSCSSIAQAVTAAGADRTYYPVGALQGSAVPLPEPSPGDIVLFIHYFGLRNERMLGACRLWRQRGVWVIEDCAQAALGSDIGRSGTFAITSLRKWLPQPDGALLSSDIPVVDRVEEANERFVSQRSWAKLLRGAGGLPADFIPLIDDSERSLDQSIVPRRMSWLSKQLLTRIDVASIAARRRENWRLLTSELRDAHVEERIAPLRWVLAEGEVPLGLPVLVENGHRDALRAFLRTREAFCPVHWPLPHVPAEGQFSGEHEMSGKILTLPLDQRMNKRHVQRLVSLISEFYGSHL